MIRKNEMKHGLNMNTFNTKQREKEHSRMKKQIQKKGSSIITLTLLILCGLTLFVYAEPSPFGVTIKKTTEEELKKKYSSLSYIGDNKFSGGKMYDVNVSEVEFEGIKSLSFILDEAGIVMAVVADIDKNRHYKVVDMLSSKYKLLFNDDAFVGNKMVAFVEDNTKIYLETPHLSLNSQLRYVHQELNDTISKIIAEEEKQKKENEAKKL